MKIKKKFFEFEKDVLIPIKQSFPKITDWDRWIICINGMRNIGKTTGGWDYVESNGMTITKKILYVRLRDAQMVFAVRDLNDTFKGKFHFTKTHIYKLEKTIRYDKDGTEIIIYTNGDLVGYVGTISTFANIKSGKFPKVEFIIFDEYNEDTNQLNIYKNFINMATTSMRFSSCKILMFGNRDTANNDFMVKWKIEPRENPDVDEIQRFSKRGFFVELGDKSYKSLGNEDTLFYELAQFDKSTKRYLDGGYMFDYSKMVINFDKFIAPSFKPKFSLAVRGNIFTFGSFFMSNEVKYSFVSAETFYDEKIKIYSLDNLSDMHKDSRLLDDEDKQDVYEFLFKKVKQQKMYYDCFDTKNILEESITRYQLFR